MTLKMLLSGQNEENFEKKFYVEEVNFSHFETAITSTLGGVRGISSYGWKSI